MMDRTRIWKRGSRALALLLAGAMVASLGTDVTSVTSVYAAESGEDTEYYCGKEEHQHTDACYETREVRRLICGKDESEGTEAHTHTEDCYSEEQVLICDKEETDDSEGHQHSDGCYDENGNLICSEEESDPIPAHHHSDECYKTERELICGKEESEAAEGHTHTDDCYETTEEQVLICKEDEHTHTDACLEPENGDPEEPESTHVANADYDQDWQDYADDTLSADKDNEETKAQTLADVASSQAGYVAQILDNDADDADAEPLYSLYSNWYTDGDNSTKDWNTTFVFWALDQAGFDTEKELDVTSTALPIRSDISAWIDALESKQDQTLNAEDAYYDALAEGDEDATPAYALTLYTDTAEDGLSLTTGDILFLDLDQDGDADHVGIAASVDSDEDTSATNSVAALIGDLDQETLAGLDEANDALDEDNSAAHVAAAIALPADDYDWDDDSADALQTYLESYIVGYIPTALYEEQVEAIEDGDADDGSDDDDALPDLDPDTIYGITYTTRSSGASRVAMREAGGAESDSSDDDIMVADVTDGTTTITGIDMSTYMNSVSYKKKSGSVWIESTEFTTDDQVRASLNFENVAVSTIKDHNNTLYIQLPDIIDCSRFTGTYDTYDGTTKSGSYQYQQVDGHWYIVLTLLGDYVKNAGDAIGGNLDFDFTWTKEAISEEGETTKVIIGTQEGDIKIEKGKNDGKQEGNKYSLKKEAGSLTYSEDGKTAYITYNVTLEVKEDVTGSITISDVLSGTGFTYDDAAPSISGSNVKVNWSNKQPNATSADIQIWANDDSDTIKAGTYTITYKVKSTVDVSDPDANIASAVENKVTVPDGDNTIESKTWTKTTTGKIDKQGKVVDGSDGKTYIDYTVYLNSGDIVKNLKTPAVFTDTLESNIELVGNVTVKQYRPDGTLVETVTVKGDGQNITYETPTGQYYYIIEYRTQVKDGVDIPIGGLQVSNTGKSEGGISGEDTADVVVPKHVLDKQFSSQQFQQIDGKWYDILTWRSEIKVDGSLEGYTYEDWSGLWTRTEPWHPTMTMTNEQREAIVVKDSDGVVIDSSKYEVSESNHEDSGISNGLFKIVFKKGVAGPVTIEYETRADMSNYAVNTWGVHFINYSSLEKDGHYDYADATSESIQYRHDNKDIIHKYGKDYTTESGSKITLDPGQDTITWTIQVNEGRTLRTDLIVKDTIADGMTYVDGSVTVSGLNYGTSAETSYSNGVLQVKIPAGSYAGNDYSNPVTISYKTRLPADFFTGSETNKTFKNTATVDYDGKTTDSEFEQNVTRQVVSKSGSYDKDTGILIYNVVLNPDASQLTEDGTGTLIVTDTLNAGTLEDYIQLDSLQLFTAVKSTDSSGKTTVAPGRLIQALTEATEADKAAQTRFTYTWDASTNRFVTYVPDKTAYVIVAQYEITAEVSETVQLKNTVQLEGKSKWSKEDSSAKAEQGTSGQTHTGHQMKIIKHDSAQYNKQLPGAHFKLEKYQDGQWVTQVEDVVTGSDGTVTISAGTRTKVIGVLYRLTETQAPSGYVIDEEHKTTYSIVLEKGSSMPTLPDGVSEADVQVVWVEVDATTSLTVIDRYNAQDTSKTEPGQLRVTKEWVDASGIKVTDASNMPDVSVTLTKHVPNKGKTFKITYSGNEFYLDKNIYPGAAIYVTFNNTNLLEYWKTSMQSAGLTLSETSEKDNNKRVYKIETITSDVSIEVSQNQFYQSGIAYVKQDGGTEPSGTTDTVIETVALDSANDWTYLWSDLDRTDGVTYTLTETSVTGYTVSYTINGLDLDPGTAFTPSADGDKITVTNTANPEYELPETGGSGTLPWQLGGTAAILFSMFSGAVMMRRRHI